MDIFFEIHKDLPREGPGNTESTHRAFSCLTELPSHPRILDIGCGPGKQTLDLIRVTDGHITAIDNHQPYIDTLNEKIKRYGLHDRITALNKDMFHLDFGEQSFHAIWAEGAIYIRGFENGLTSWKRFLKPNGYMAVTEISWLRPDAPAELRSFWDEGYPGIQTIESNLELIKKCGYQVVDYFILPERAWWEEYYNPIQNRLNKLREKYQDDEEALEIIESEQSEIELYARYSDFYGYVFYIMQLC